MSLSDLKIKKAQVREKPYKLPDGGGLFLLVKPNGSRLWQQKYRYLGKERLLSHGPYPDVSLAQARKKREEARAVLADGRDPAVQKRLDQIAAETMGRTTFLLVAEEYLQMAYLRELADATMRKKIWHIHTLAEPLHQRPINAITSAEVLHLLKRVQHSGRRETAKKLRGTLSGVFRLAVVTLRADNDPTQAIKGALLPVKVTNRAAITDEKVFGQFLRDLDAYTGAGVIKDALLFQILTMTPGVTPGVCDTPVSLLDLSATIPAHFGVEFACEGRPLPDIAVAPADPDRIVFSEYHAAGAVSAAFMLRKGRWKLNHYVGFESELFDLKTDPEETVNLAADPAHAATMSALQQELRRIVDPDAVDAQAFADQAELIRRHGGREAALALGAPGATPPPAGFDSDAAGRNAPAPRLHLSSARPDDRSREGATAARDRARWRFSSPPPPWLDGRGPRIPR